MLFVDAEGNLGGKWSNRRLERSITQKEEKKGTHSLCPSRAHIWQVNLRSQDVRVQVKRCGIRVILLAQNHTEFHVHSI